MGERMKIDLNCDMGESFGRYVLGADEALLGWVTSANIACGLHAGDPLVMRATVRQAVEHGVCIGAHPGYPDLQGFGRREMNLGEDEIEAFMLYQIGALAAFTRELGVELTHVKPHGALYNQAARDRKLADAIIRSVASYSRHLIVVGLAGSELVAAGLDAGMRVAREGFPDRAYRPDGSLKSRREAGAILETTEAVCAQALALAEHGAGEGSGSSIDTLCIHGDGAHALEFARAVRAVLESNGIQVVRLDEIV